MQLRGYTFEFKTDSAYSEHFVYEEKADKSVKYDFYMFRDPGLKRILRYRMFNWGISSLNKIIEQSQKLQKKKLEAQEKAQEMLKNKKEVITEKLDKAKTKVQSLKKNKTINEEDIANAAEKKLWFDSAFRS